jgi:hypothetical protein
VSGTDTQQAPPPPPPPPSGSPFGRFLTSPVLLVGVIALVVGFAVLRYVGGDGGGSAAPAASVVGSWATPPTGAGSHERVVQLEVARSGGTLAVDNCTGDLTPRETGSDEWVFSYADTSGERGCPRRMIVTVSLVDRNSLRVAARRPSGRVEFAGKVSRMR